MGLLSTAIKAGKKAATGLLDASQAARQIDTPEFKNWFGKSRVADESGQPLRVYHGTAEDFDEFKPSKTGIFGKGIYFTTDPKRASNYADVEGGSVVPAYISIKKPYVVSFDKDTWDDIYQKVTGTTPKNAGDEYPNPRQVEKLKSALQERGYDGFEVLGVEGTEEKYWIPFDPTQIKSAIGNRGTFDPSNPNIMYGVGGTGILGGISQQREDRNK